MCAICSLACAQAYIEKTNNRQKREYPIIPCFDYKSRWKRSKRKRGYPADERRCTSRSSSRHRTSRYSLVTRVRRAAVLFRALRRCQIIPAGLCHVHAGLRVRYIRGTYRPRRCRIRWSAIRCSSRLNRGATKMQFQRFRRATAKSRCNVTKMCTGVLRIPPRFNGVSISPGFAISDTNLYDLRAYQMNYVKCNGKLRFAKRIFLY